MKGEIVNWGVEITDNCIMVEITHNSKDHPLEQRGIRRECYNNISVFDLSN